MIAFILAAVALLLPQGALAGPTKPSVLRTTFSTAMTNTEVDGDARGKVIGDLLLRGRVYNQTLKITLSHLDPNTPYELTASVGDDPNAAPVSIADFTTDANGKAKLSYARRVQRNDDGLREPLHDALDPLSELNALFILDETSAVVLEVDIIDADRWFYYTMRAMNQTGVIPGAAGDLRLKGSQAFSEFRLNARALIPSSTYRLVINDVEFVEIYTSDAQGALSIRALPIGAPDIRDIRSLALIDDEDVVVLISGLGTVESAVPLGAAEDFAVLAGSTVTNTGATTVTGDLGVSPGSAVTGFPPGVLVGTQHVADPTAAQAQLDLTTAYNDAAGRTLAPISVAGNIGGQTLAPGLYKSTGSLEISSGDLTLDAQGDANGVFIFQIDTELLTTAGRQVILSGGAKAKNVFWQVGTSATIGTTSVFKGTIMADQSITLLTGATLEGRALARIAAVNLAGSPVTLP